MFRPVPAVFAAALVSIVSPGRAADPVPAESCRVSVGSKPVTVPYPEGFVRCDGVNETFDARIRSFTPDTHRMLAYFASPEDLEQIKNDAILPIKRSFNVQVVKTAENLDVGQRTFAGMRDQMKAGLDKSLSSADETIKRLTAEGTTKMKEEHGIEYQLNVSGTAFLGYFEDSDTSLGFTMILKTKTKDEEGHDVTDRTIAAALLAPVNGRLLSFGAFYPYEKDVDRKAAEKAVAAWRDAVVAANPRVQGPEAESRARKLGEAVGSLAGAGIVVAVIVVIAKKRAARKLGTPPPLPPPLSPPE